MYKYYLNISRVEKVQRSLNFVKHNEKRSDILKNIRIFYLIRTYTYKYIHARTLKHI